MSVNHYALVYNTLYCIVTELDTTRSKYVWSTSNPETQISTQFALQTSTCVHISQIQKFVLQQQTVQLF